MKKTDLFAGITCFASRCRMRIKWRSQLFIIFLSVSLLPLILFLSVVYRVVEDAVTNQAKDYFVRSVAKERVLIDNELDYIEEFSQKLNIDKRIYQIFSRLDRAEALQLKQASDQVASILNSYKPWGNHIYSTHIMTPYYRFGEGDKNFYPEGSFYASELAEMAIKAQGHLVWVPTYDYVEMFGIDNLRKEQIEYGALFSAVRRMNVSDVSTGRMKRLDNGEGSPILIVNFREDFILSMLEEYGEMGLGDNTYYMVMDEGGKIVCSTNEAYTGGSQYEEVWLEQLGEKGNEGHLFQELNKERYLITYSKSNITGWFVVAFVPIHDLVREINDNILFFMAAIMVVLVIFAFFASYYSADYLNRKIYRILTTVERIGTGEFGSRITFDERDEFSFFYQKINDMSLNLSKLIHENYEVKLQSKDFEVMILNIQLNPHFLYNTLNMINWLCIEGDAEKASTMIVELSRMLQYTSQNSRQTVCLRDDIAWLTRYMMIMKKRYGNEFEVHFDIEKDMMECEVPKLFLQPLIENAIVHGFKHMDRKGELSVSLEREGKDIIFAVEDNGRGMTQEKIKEVMSGSSQSIGVVNTDRRIKILYGENYGVTIESQPGEGTIVFVTIPTLG